MAVFPGFIRNAVTRDLDALKGPVTMIVFTSNADCEPCDQSEALYRELASLSDHLTLEIHNRHAEPEVAARYGVDKAPALVLEGPAGARVRFYGIPSGLEFATLLQALADTAAGAAQLTTGTWTKIAKLRRPVHLQVFVTPTCPYCPPAVRTAHKLATASPLITADMIESTAFPEQAEHYGVRGVPHVVINERAAFDGADDEASFVDAVMAAVAAEPAGLPA